MQLYPSEEDCRQASSSIAGPRGSSARAAAIAAPGILPAAVSTECAQCHYQGSLTAGTVLAGTRTDLRKWLLAIWLLASTKKAPSAAELSRQLGVTAKGRLASAAQDHPREAAQEG